MDPSPDPAFPLWRRQSETIRVVPTSGGPTLPSSAPINLKVAEETSRGHTDLNECSRLAALSEDDHTTLELMSRILEPDDFMFPESESEPSEPAEYLQFLLQWWKYSTDCKSKSEEYWDGIMEQWHSESSAAVAGCSAAVCPSLPPLDSEAVWSPPPLRVLSLGPNLRPESLANLKPSRPKAPTRPEIVVNLNPWRKD